MVAYLKQHPGEVYLPWDPWLTWSAEHRRDHFEYGVFDRALAGEPISRKHYLEGLPPRIRFVAVPVNKAPGPESAYLHYLPGLRKITAPTGLEQWTFYALASPFLATENAR